MHEVSAAELGEMQRLKAYTRRSRAVTDLSAQEIADMTAGRMDAEHEHLNALLDEE